MAHILSDLLVESGQDITDAMFETKLKYGSAPGYDDFRTYLLGDIEYQNALWRLAFSTLNGDRPRADKCVLEVDVLDLFDRGQVIVPASQHVVNFNRSFNVPPEVTAQQKGGSTAFTINIISVTTTGFTVECKSGGVFVSGTISWAAQGY